jgi:ABC-type uncharacterized transport system
VKLRAFVFLAVCVLLATSACGQSRKGDIQPELPPTYAVLTNLPLFWGEGAFGDVVGGKNQRAQFIQQLSEKVTIRAVDAIEGDTLAGVTVLILAQPRLLGPHELVIIDSWVRAGGRVIAFADPLLNWPSALAVGDKRRAPPVTLLDPLFGHWGLALEGGTDGAAADRLLDEVRVSTIGAGRWRATKTACTVGGDGLVARCKIGAGHATFIADTDLLDERPSVANVTSAVQWIVTETSRKL